MATITKYVIINECRGDTECDIGGIINDRTYHDKASAIQAMWETIHKYAKSFGIDISNADETSDVFTINNCGVEHIYHVEELNEEVNPLDLVKQAVTLLRAEGKQLVVGNEHDSSPFIGTAPANASTSSPDFIEDSDHRVSLSEKHLCSILTVNYAIGEEIIGG